MDRYMILFLSSGELCVHCAQGIVILPSLIDVFSFTHTVSLYLICSFAVVIPWLGSPAPWVRWFKNGLEIHMDRSEQGVSLAENGSLVIGSVSPSHSGDFKCVATNEAGSVERKTRLKVNVPPEIQEDGQPLNLTVTLKQPLTLGCDAFGIPTPTITWTKDNRHVLETPGVHLQNGKRLLKIYRVQHDHAGHFSCTAQNSAGEARREYTVEVQAPPVISGISGVQELTVIAGQEVDMQCRVSGHPLPTVEWSHDGEVLSPYGDPHVEFLEKGQVLRVKSVRPRDRGLYQCMASNNAGTQTRQFRLNVQTAPMIRDAGENSEGTVILGFPAVLHCEVEGIPLPTITWLKNNQPIVSSPQLTYTQGGQSLRVAAARGEDAGTYTCRATNPAGTVHRHHTLRVMVPPQIEGDSTTLSFGRRERGHVLQIPWIQLEDAGKYPCQAVNEAGEDKMHYDLEVLVPPVIDGQTDEFMQDVEAVVNSTVSLRCDVTGNPTPSVSWLKDDLPLYSGPHHQILEDGKLLEILNVQVSGAASYQCVAENKAGMVERLYSLSVQVPPRIVGRREEDMSVVEGHMISLLCDMQAYPPADPGDIIWTKDGQVLEFSTGIHILPGGLQILQLPRAGQKDAGQYICTATNSAGQDQKSILLTVYALPTLVPRFESESEVMTPQVGSSIILRCEANGIPEPEVTWYRNGLQLTAGNGLRIEHQQLEIVGVQVADGGVYTCKVSNIAGQVDRIFRVTVHVPPVMEGPLHETLTQNMGSHITLICEASGVPIPNIAWLKDSSPIESSLQWNWSVRGNRLELGPLQVSHEGIYTCIAKNSEGQAQKDYSLTIYAPPQISAGQSEMTVIQGFQALLPCAAQGLPEPRPGDAGLFTCVATNTAGTARRDIRLSVNMRPAFKELPGDVTLNKGQSLTLSCHAQGTPHPTITWTANNRPYTGASVDGSGRSSVIIDNISVSNGGTYVCIAENTVGSIRALSFVRVR
ncbi:hypothetical protein cypCar_00042446, partial [Cyprinus carpio]